MSTQSLTKLPAQRVGAAGAGSVHVAQTSQGNASALPSDAFAEIILDKDGKHLTPSETALFRAFIAANGRTLNVEYLIGRIKARDLVSDENCLRCLICRIRRKRPDVKIKAIYSIGYVMERVA